MESVGMTLYLLLIHLLPTFNGISGLGCLQLPLINPLGTPNEYYWPRLQTL